MALTKVASRALGSAITASIADNTAKLSNATHTGDVTGATALTIAVDAVDIPMLSASGTASSTTFLRGDNAWVEVGGAYNDFLIKTADFTCAAKDQIICNHASTAFAITLPASPSPTQSVIIANAGAALVTVGRNSSNINSAAENGTLPQGNSVQLVYIDSTIGWFAI